MGRREDYKTSHKLPIIPSSFFFFSSGEGGGGGLTFESLIYETLQRMSLPIGYYLNTFFLFNLNK